MRIFVKLRNTLTGLFESQYFGIGFIILGIIIQVLCFLGAEEKSTLSLISGCLGIAAVVLTSRRSLWFYLFGILQLLTYTWICIGERLWGEVGENIFYLITMIFGYFMWKKTYDGSKIKTREMSKFTLTILLIFTGAMVWGLYKILGVYSTDSQPFMGSISTVPAIVAQFLLIYRFKEQWLFWAIINVASIIMWFEAGNLNMVAQFVFWLLNCFYGWIIWSDQDY